MLKKTAFFSHDGFPYVIYGPLPSMSHKSNEIKFFFFKYVEKISQFSSIVFQILCFFLGLDSVTC